MARGNSLGSATIQLELEYAKVSKGIDQVNKKLGGFQKGLKRMGGVLKGVFAVGSVYAFSRALNSTLSELDKIGKTAAKIGVTTDALQELRFAAEQSGVNVQALDMGLQRFVRRTAEAAQGTGVLKTEFENLGISLKNSDGSLRSVEAVLGDYADAIANASDSQEQLRLAFKAFDSEGAALVNLFRNGKIGVEELRQELRDLGGVIDSNLIAKAESANDAMNRVSKAMGGTFKTALASLAPIIERVANWIVELTKRWRAFFEGTIPLAELSISQLQKQSERAASDVEKWTKAIEGHEEKVKTMAGAYTSSGSELEYLKKMLAESQERFKKVNEEMDIAERTGRALTDTSSSLGDALGEVGDGGNDAADGLKAASEAARTFTERLDKVGGSMSDMQLKTANERLKEIPETIDEATESLFDMDEALKQVQNNIQGGFSDLFYDLFSGKGIESVKDFAKRVLDIFKRLIADIAAAWAASKIFNIPMGGGGIGGLISGGGIGGGIGQGTGIGESVASSGIGKAISSGFGKLGTALKGIFSGGNAAAAGNLAFKGPGAFATKAVGQGFGANMGAWGAAVPLAIGAFGFSRMASKKARRVELQQQFFNQVGTGTNEQLGASGFDFRGQLDASNAFFSTMREGWDSTMKALSEVGVLTKGWGAQLDEAGRGLVKMQGDIPAIKTALQNASISAYDFVGNLELAEEKGNAIRVNLTGDFEVIKQKILEAGAQGLTSFRDLEQTATGASLRITNDWSSWADFFQSIVNSSIYDAVTGTRALASSFDSASAAARRLASASSGIQVSSRSNQLERFATGGISNKPAIFGEAGPEAAVPLPDGRTIPVTVKGGISNGRTEALLERILKAIERRDLAAKGFALA